LAITLYFKEISLVEQAQKHATVASKLWGVREQLLSLLIDMQDSLSSEDLRQQRDVINKALEEIYKDAPRTDQRAYAAAKRALKAEEELFFTDNELDLMLPHVLRRTKK
jgi:negative regulator of replication initiation